MKLKAKKRSLSGHKKVEYQQTRNLHQQFPTKSSAIHKKFQAPQPPTKHDSDQDNHTTRSSAEWSTIATYKWQSHEWAILHPVTQLIILLRRHFP